VPESDGRSASYNTSGLVTIKLALFHVAKPQAHPPAVTDRCRCAEWIAMPKESGVFFAEIALYPGQQAFGAAPLVEVTTERFTVAAS
jgi:hypothetical protein